MPTDPARCPTCGRTTTPPHPCLYCDLVAGMVEADARAAADRAAMRPEDHVLDEGSVINPETGRPWLGSTGPEPYDPPDPLCVCGAYWVDGGCDYLAGRTP